MDFYFNFIQITQLFFLHKTLDASEALQAGLISKIIAGNIDAQFKEISESFTARSSQVRTFLPNIIIFSSHAIGFVKKIIVEELLDLLLYF